MGSRCDHNVTGLLRFLLLLPPEALAPSSNPSQILPSLHESEDLDACRPEGEERESKRPKVTLEREGKGRAADNVGHRDEVAHASAPAGESPPLPNSWEKEGVR